MSLFYIYEENNLKQKITKVNNNLLYILIDFICIFCNFYLFCVFVNKIYIYFIVLYLLYCIYCINKYKYKQ